MRQALAAALILGTAAFGQEPVVQRSTIWMDAAKRGSMPVAMRGTGTLTTNMTAELKIPESGDLPPEARAGAAVEGAIQIATLNDVIF